MSTTPPKTTATASFAIAIFAAVMIFVPELVGFDGGFAISFASILIAIIATIVGIMYLGWANKLDRILRGEGILAHWTYTPQLWS